MKPEIIPKGLAAGTAAVTEAPSGRTVQSILEGFSHGGVDHRLHNQKEDWHAKGEERYHAFVSRSEDGMWCVEFDQPIPTGLPAKEQLALVYRHCYFSECNDAAAKLLGANDGREEVVGRNAVDVSSRRVVREAYLDLIRSAYRFTTSETAKRLPDGKRHSVLLSQLGIVENGMLCRIWGVTRDVTDFKQVQRHLKAAKRRMRDLLQTVQLFVVVLDPVGAIETCSSYFTELTNWRPDELRGKNWFELIPPEERADLQEKFAGQLASPTRPMHFESTLLGPDGKRWQVAWDATAMRDDKLKIKAIANIGRDITEKKAVEAHLRQLQKIESIGKLAGGIAHDFNNLLTVIGGYASHLLDQHTPGDPEYPELREIRNAVETAAQLTQQILTFSRRRASTSEALNLNGILERDCSILRRTLGNNIELVTRLDPSLGLVKVDPVEISQILLNLAVNARDAMPGGGRLTIASSNATISGGDGAVVPAVPAGQYVQLSVTDTGTGMTREVLDHLFEPFFTTKEAGQGTGLGLPIIFGIVKQSGGHISVESALGRGTSFRIFLPRT